MLAGKSLVLRNDFALGESQHRKRAFSLPTFQLVFESLVKLQGTSLTTKLLYPDVCGQLVTLSVPPKYHILP